MIFQAEHVQIKSREPVEDTCSCFGHVMIIWSFLRDNKEGEHSAVPASLWVKVEPEQLKPWETCPHSDVGFKWLRSITMI